MVLGLGVLVCSSECLCIPGMCWECCWDSSVGGGHSWPCALQSFNISMHVSNVFFGPEWAKLNVAFNLRWAADLYKTHTRLPGVAVEPPVLEIFKNHLGKHVRSDKSWADPALGWEAGQMASRGPGPTAGGQRGISERNKNQKPDLCRSAPAKKHAHC